GRIPESSVVVAEHGFRQRAGVVLRQAPATGALTEDGPAAVGETAQALPVARVETEQPADGGADRAAVADHDERAVLRELVDVPQHHGGGSVGDLGLQFAPAPADRLTALPRGVLVAVPGDDLVVRQALPDARVGLPQGLVV